MSSLQSDFMWGNSRGDWELSWRHNANKDFKETYEVGRKEGKDVGEMNREELGRLSDWGEEEESRG